MNLSLSTQEKRAIPQLQLHKTSAELQEWLSSLNQEIKQEKNKDKIIEKLQQKLIQQDDKLSKLKKQKLNEGIITREINKKPVVERDRNDKRKSANVKYLNRILNYIQDERNTGMKHTKTDFKSQLLISNQVLDEALAFLVKHNLIKEEYSCGSYRYYK